MLPLQNLARKGFKWNAHDCVVICIAASVISFMFHNENIQFSIAPE